MYSKILVCNKSESRCFRQCLLVLYSITTCRVHMLCSESQLPAAEHCSTGKHCQGHISFCLLLIANTFSVVNHSETFTVVIFSYSPHSLKLCRRAKVCTLQWGEVSSSVENVSSQSRIQWLRLLVFYCSTVLLIFLSTV